MTSVRVAIDGRFVPGSGGGVESLVAGLAQGLQSLGKTDVQVSFVTYQGHSDWIRRYTDAPFDLIEVPIPAKYHRFVRRGRFWALRRASGSYSALPMRDRVMDSVAADVVHLPFQGRGWVRKPYVYHPH